MNHDTIMSKGVLASKEKRFLNFVIDYVMQLIVGVVMGFVLFFIAEIFNSDALYGFLDEDNTLTDYLFSFIILVGYYSIIEALTARSIGKFITQTKVINEEGEAPDFKDALLRSLCRLIPFEALSFLGSDGRGWHDSITNTYVVDVKKFEAMQNSETEIDLIGKIQED
ncbi:MAG: RDD family protein [bacterium]